MIHRLSNQHLLSHSQAAESGVLFLKHSAFQTCGSVGGQMHAAQNIYHDIFIVLFEIVSPETRSA